VTTSGAPLLTEQLTRLRASWPGGAWEWDGRFGCALAAVGKALEAKAREALAVELPSVWTAATLGQAPAALQKLCAGVGGLRADQLAFSAEVDGVLAYCLWWPWGGGANFSARVGVLGESNLSALVRGAFGITGR
jgi:hypothetical protein